MELILWRHAEAADGSPDEARPLTEKGKRQAEKMAHFLSAHLPEKTRILVSPAVRAQQTAAALTSHFITVPDIGVGATTHNALAAAGWPKGDGCVLLVGHQPWLGELAATLLTGQADEWSIKKGAVWWFSRRERDSQAVLRLAMSPDYL